MDSRSNIELLRTFKIIVMMMGLVHGFLPSVRASAPEAIDVVALENSDVTNQLHATAAVSSALGREYSFELDMRHVSFVNANKSYFGAKEENLADFSNLGLGFKWSGRNTKVEGRAFYVPQENEAYFEVPELSRQWRFESSSLWAGRHLHGWSELDVFWDTGAWQPRFLWDRFRPMQEGLTGVFWQTKWGKKTASMLFVSPLSVPDRESAYVEENGIIRASSPWFRTPPRIVELWSHETPVTASVAEPEIEDIVYRPSAAVQLQRQWSPYWKSHLSYGYKPVQQLRMTYDYFVRSRVDSSETVITFHPQYPYEHVTTLETKWSSGRWAVVGGVTRQSPEQEQTPNEWNAQDFAAFTTAALFVEWQENPKWTKSPRVYSGFLKVWAPAAADLGENAQDETQFDIRQPFFLAYRLGYEGRLARWRNRDMRLRLEGTYDFEQIGGMIKSELQYELARNLEVSFSANVIGTLSEKKNEFDKAFLRTYRANDDVGLEVSYVF